MDTIFSERIRNIPKSFIREILKVTVNPEIISFAGGLPNPELFPVEEIKAACVKVLESDGKNALQYSTSEGYLPLRSYIAERYRKKDGLNILPEEILITNGSQQALDLLGKIFLNEGDSIIIERPGYLGAIQALSLYKPHFCTVPLCDHGPDTELLEKLLTSHPVKFFYGIPNFQNPSGITYSKENRKVTANLLKQHNTLFIEDNPYGELRFIGEDLPSLKTYLGDTAILLGTFSKTVIPSFRIGWICARKDIMEKLLVAKQGADLHTDYFAQRVVYQYLSDNDIDSHITRIRSVYKRQREKMISMIETTFPAEVTCTKPEGGMFLWVTLPKNLSAMELFDRAIRKNVAFVPGNPFFLEGGENTLRLNFSNSNESQIEVGIKRLSEAMKDLLHNNFGSGN
ncbi:MAG: PLP-dependent aminotransferase family protein [Spirochaetota bacterium]